MDIDEILLEAESQLDEAVTGLQHKLGLVRTGRANPALFENIEVEAYGGRVPLIKLGQIGVPEARLVVIKPFDPHVLGAIEKAILAANMGITPQNDGHFIRLAIPGLNEERRKLIAKEVREIGEQFIVRMRNIRRDAMKGIDQAENDGLSEDDAARGRDAMQETFKGYEKQVEEQVAKKVTEVTTL
ncbi:MAG: ribosome recycling factor [Planctomycetota bacterium]